ncbi:RloB family protein [Methanoplanus endosymbiosus]|uniref:RloB family protein n=1 Tax=Methanoplanus endosymbiosus TaxID=33865 RepID=A0A9E7TIV6_9EURY|nr:RloB family protein [Methanoplanus endosymbiosus]UUX91229.1 RloB family protein [Methanoplanus endosymbiosus]
MKWQLYVSNPCFELWILMHLSVIHELDRNKMYENRKINRNKCFLEAEVKKELPEYRKNNLPFERLIDKVEDAIINEHLFCENPDELEFNLGSNVGLLLTELKKGCS